MAEGKIYRLSRYGLNLFRANAVISGYNQKSYQKVSLLLDTGSSFTILPRPILEYLGYNLKFPIRYQTITTAKGNTSALPVIEVRWFNCLGQIIENFEVVAYNLPNNIRVNGLLGMDFLTQTKAVISIDTAEVKFKQ
jgi:aspartyl protease family protein